MQYIQGPKLNPQSQVRSTHQCIQYQWAIRKFGKVPQGEISLESPIFIVINFKPNFYIRMLFLRLFEFIFRAPVISIFDYTFAEFF